MIKKGNFISTPELFLRIAFFFILTAPLQSSEYPKNAEIKKMLNSAFLNRVEINAYSLQDALQELCDLLVEKQKDKNEKHIVFRLEMPPISGTQIRFNQKYKRGDELLELFCKKYGLFYRIEKGQIILEISPQAKIHQQTIEKLEQVSLPEVRITAEYLPSALRKLLRRQRLSFTLQSPKQLANGKTAPIHLKNLRISKYRKKNTNLYAVLNDLANLTQMQAWITPYGITFTAKKSKNYQVIRGSKFK